MQHPSQHAAEGVARATAKQQPSKKPPTLASALSGALSGALISACVQPLDVVRTRMQGDAAHGIARSSLATVTDILKEGGVPGLWRGTQPSMLRVGLGAGLQFVLLEQLKAVLLSTQAVQDGGRLTAAGAALAGGLSRAVAAVLLCPVTVVKTRMEYSSHLSNVPQYRNTAHALWSIAQHEGARGLFQGLVPTVLTNAPFSGLYYMFYTQLKSHFSEEGRPQALVNFGSGVAASVAATLLTQPTDVIRTRLQLRLASSGTNTLVALTTILREQGFRALLTGLGPRIIKRTTQTALVWTLYEELVPRVIQATAWANKHVQSMATVKQPDSPAVPGALDHYVTPLQTQEHAQEQKVHDAIQPRPHGKK